MIERLAIPGWKTPPRSLEDWSRELKRLGAAPKIVRDADGDEWIELASDRTRGLVLREGGSIEAIHFEITDPDPHLALQRLGFAASALAWELYDADVENDDDGLETGSDQDLERAQSHFGETRP